MEEGRVKLKSQNPYIQRIHELYITKMDKFLIQNPDGSYITKSTRLNNRWLASHLSQNATIGIFCGPIIGSKFLCFDIDSGDNSLFLMRRLNMLLIDNGVPPEAILNSFSGKKGYHVDLFFEKPKKIERMRDLFNRVIALLGEEITIQPNDIELRPTDMQGVKLPMSLHKLTGAVCSYVSLSGRPIPYPEALNAARGLSDDDFDRLMDTLPEIAPKKAQNEIKIDKKAKKFVKKEFEKITDDLFLIDLDSQKHLEEVIAANHLIYPATRHKVTYQLLSYLYNVVGFSLEEAGIKVKEVIKTTFAEHRELIDIGTTEEFALSEIDRLIDGGYIKLFDYENAQKKECNVFANEALYVLSAATQPQRKLLAVFLIHWIRLGRRNSFYITFSQMRRYGSNSKELALKKTIDSLVAQGLLTVIQEPIKMGKRFTPRWFALNIKGTSEKTASKEINHYEDLFSLLPSLLDKEEVKNLLRDPAAISKRNEDATFNKYYSALYK